MGLFVEYSNMWNLTGFPAGILPVCDVLEKEQQFKDSYNDSWTKVLNEDAQGSQGLPVTIQVIGYAFEDENVLGVMKVIEEKAKYKMK